MDQEPDTPDFKPGKETKFCPACALSIDRRSFARHWRDKHSGPREDYLEDDPRINNKTIDKIRIFNGTVQYRVNDYYNCKTENV